MLFPLLSVATSFSRPVDIQAVFWDNSSWIFCEIISTFLFSCRQKSSVSVFPETCVLSYYVFSCAFMCPCEVIYVCKALMLLQISPWRPETLLRYILCWGTLVPPGKIRHINPPITQTQPSRHPLVPRRTTLSWPMLREMLWVVQVFLFIWNCNHFLEPTSRVPACRKRGPKARTSCLDLQFRLSQVSWHNLSIVSWCFLGSPRSWPCPKHLPLEASRNYASPMLEPAPFTALHLNVWTSRPQARHPHKPNPGFGAWEKSSRNYLHPQFFQKWTVLPPTELKKIPLVQKKLRKKAENQGFWLFVSLMQQSWINENASVSHSLTWKACELGRRWEWEEGFVVT